jgi:hypothetical protein
MVLGARAEFVNDSANTVTDTSLASAPGSGSAGVDGVWWLGARAEFVNDSANAVSKRRRRRWPAGRCALMVARRSRGARQRQRQRRQQAPASALACRQMRAEFGKCE